MSVSFLDKLKTAGDAFSGKIIRAIGGISPTNTVKPLLTTSEGRLQVALPTSGSSIDVFGRLRTSTPFSLFDVKHVFDKQPTIIVEDSVTGATQTHDATRSSVNMVVTSTNGSRARRRSKFHIPYEPGRSPQCLMTVVFGTGLTGIVKKFGLFDDTDGLYFQQNGSTLSVNVTNSLTGGGTTTVNRSSWDDPLDGTGPSGINITLTNGCIFVIEFGWLGYAGVRFGVQVNNTIYYCHSIALDGALTRPFMKRGSLPLQWEIRNTTGATVTAGVDDFLRVTCASYFSEGGYSPLGYSRAGTRKAARNLSGVGATEPLLSVRLKSGYKEGLLLPTGFGAVSEDNKINLIELVVGATLSTPSWTSLSDATEVDTASTSMSGGSVVASILSSAGTSGREKFDFRNLPGYDYSGNVDIVTIRVTRLQTGNSNYYANLNFDEVY